MSEASEVSEQRRQTPWWTKKCSEVRVDGDARDARGAPRARSSRESPRGRARRVDRRDVRPRWVSNPRAGVPGRARLSNHRGGGPTRWTRRFGARGGGKRGGEPREHLQLLHAAVVSLFVETTFARHNSAGGSGRDGGQNTRGTCAISRRLGARARTTEKKLGKIAVPRRRWRDRPEYGATAGRDAARNAPSPGGVQAEHPRDGVDASGTRCALPPRLARSPAHSSATRDAQGLQRLQRMGAGRPLRADARRAGRTLTFLDFG